MYCGAAIINYEYTLCQIIATQLFQYDTSINANRIALLRKKLISN